VRRSVHSTHAAAVCCKPKESALKRFWLGFITAAVCLVLAVFCYVRFGFVNPRADIPVNSLDRSVAMPALDAAVDRRAPETKNPLQPTDENLTSGMKMYQQQCSSCHGDTLHHEGMLADALYPRAPQFMEDAPDMSEDQNFYILQHGIRYSGMPAWKQTFSDKQLWQITTFLSHMDKLPPAVSAQWQVSAKSNAPSGGY
jgi:mono/diheme cytochrome c family protein